MINGSDIVNTAKSLLGKVQYVFGASNIPGGSGDCSSFTQYVYGKNDISIGRDTQSQWTGTGTKISRSELSPGDLVFFKNTYNSNHTDGVSHVGIYIGNDSFIHLNSKGVTTSSLNEEYWNNHYLGAKHIGDVSISPDNTISSDNIVNVGFMGDAKEWFTDQAENILKYLAMVLVLIVGVVFIGLSIYKLGDE